MIKDYQSISHDKAIQIHEKQIYLKNSPNLGQIGLKISQKWSIFPVISRGRISREKCLAKPFLVLARNARNVQVYLKPL